MLQDNGGTVITLKDKECKLSLRLSQAEHRCSELSQALSEGQAEVGALRAELEDNVQRWEQECAARLQAQDTLHATQVSLNQARSMAKSAHDRAKVSEQERDAATQQLAQLKARRGCLIALKVLLTSCLCFWTLWRERNPKSYPFSALVSCWHTKGPDVLCTESGHRGRQGCLLHAATWTCMQQPRPPCPACKCQSSCQSITIILI